MNRNLTARDLQTRVVANRAGQHLGGPFFVTGMFTCPCCGGNVVNTAECARIIGVGAQTLSKWLRREPIRQELANKIRSAFLRVEE